MRLSKFIAVAIAICALAQGAQAQVARQKLRGNNVSEWHESERSDKFTGGRIERGELVPGDPDIWLTLNVPSFRLTLWQSGREVKSYYVGVGRKDFPIVIGEREAHEVIWNPGWSPPDSSWVREMPGIRPGQYIRPGDPRNPIGKLKIPLGGGYLIHQAKGTGDLANLVSHGCIRMLKSDLYDLAERIVAARELPVSRRQINSAKRSSKTLVAKLDQPLPVDINYDTAVVEGGVLHLYPDVYSDRRNATPARLRAELESSGVNTSRLDDETLNELLSQVTRKTRFEVDVRSIEQGRAIADGRLVPLIARPEAKKSARRRQRAD